MPAQVAALYVETDGCYFGLPGVDPWDEARDARLYRGPDSVIAHPPCQRWGRFWHGSTRKPHQFKLGGDGGCFKAALAAIEEYGGVIEHPMDSHAWPYFDITKPPRSGGWVAANIDANAELRRLGFGPETETYRTLRAIGEMKETMWTCCVYQGHYGHLAGKGTWLLTSRVPRELLPELRWGPVEQRIHPRALELHGYEKARRIGMMAMVGGKDKTRIRNATPPEFRDVLLSIARSVNKAA